MDQDRRPDHRPHLPLLLTHLRTGSLADDRQLQPAGNIVPVVHAGAAARYGTRLASALDAVSARLTTSDLIHLNRQITVADHSVLAEARAWLERQGILPSRAELARRLTTCMPPAPPSPATPPGARVAEDDEDLKHPARDCCLPQAGTGHGSFDGRVAGIATWTPATSQRLREEEPDD